MDAWFRGRVALVGDAAFAPSFLAGQGSALAMLGAYILAGELKASLGEPARAFLRYHHRLCDLMARKQKAALSLSDNFAPPSRLSVFLQNHLSSAVGLPFVADLLFGRLIRDRFPLPAY
jgi:2-polyprenyl-6-methoxyphenol hydroxylase-like FAD-dependent oxidoreductase